MTDKELKEQHDESKESSKRKGQIKKLTEEIEQLQAQVADLQAQLAVKDNLLAEANDKFLRLAAEFDNYRKRRERDIQQITEYAGEETLRQILPVFDDLERATQNTGEQASEQSIREGLELIYRKFAKVLKDLGVESYESVNQPFNPDLHYAVMQQEVADTPSDMVVAEFEKGYKYRQRILRHAKVVVSK